LRDELDAVVRQVRVLQLDARARVQPSPRVVGAGPDGQAE
jgi:hypothetical protein